MSYGRTVAAFNWAEGNFEYFDAWCCVRGIDPLDLPAYRFYNVVLYCMKDDKTDEGLTMIEQYFSAFDSMEHPLKELIKPGKNSRSKTIKPESRHSYVPPWWRGDTQNASIALKVMKEVPTEIGQGVSDKAPG